MRAWISGGALFFVLLTASCGGSSTVPTITITPATQGVLVNGTTLFTASVTGATNTGITWTICLPPTKSGNQPVDCGNNTLGKITQVQGTFTAIYTAPTTVPNPSTFDVVAFSVQNDLYFGAAQVTVSTGVQVQLSPGTATVDELQSIIFSATVTGTTNKTVSWAINGNSISGGNPQLGTLTPGPNNTAVYTAPGAAPTSSITVSATSVSDPSSSAQASVTVVAPANPSVSAISPTVAAEGSAQQDVYVEGSGFVTNDTVYAGFGTPSTPVTTFFISTSLLRATIPQPFFTETGTLSLQVVRSANVVSQTQLLQVQAVRPALLTSAPSALNTPDTAALNVTLTGGFYVPGRTQAYFNGLGSANGVNTQIPNVPNPPLSRQMIVTIPQNSLGTAGLYPIFVGNPDVPQGLPAFASTNLAVEPAAQTIPTLQAANFPVGSSPAAVAIDQALGIAVVANAGDGSVAVIDLATQSVTKTIANVAKTPTGIAVDDLLTPNVAVVVDNAQNSVVAINLSNYVISSPVTLPVTSTTNPPPVSIGINPVTHRALVASETTNLGTILNLSISPNGAPLITVAQQVGGGFTNYSTGLNPAIAVDTRLNWAIVAPGGGGGAIDVVDLGNAVSPLYPSGRNAEVVFTTSVSGQLSPTGVGVDQETHTALFTDPGASTAATVSLLDNTVTPVSFLAQSGTGYVAAGVSMTSDLGVVVNRNTNTAAVVDMFGQQVLQTGIAVGSFPQAVAVDAATNEAVILNANDGTASLLSLGPIRSLHITESNPTDTVTSSAPLSLTLYGSGFVSGTSQVYLDSIALPAANVSVVSAREIVATVPASFLSAARRFSVTVQNPGGGVNLQSNEVDLDVIEPVPVGQAPVGVAVDANLDLAVVSNSADNTASLVSLTNGVVLSPSPISVGADPQGVAVLPRSSLAIVAGSASNEVTILDETGINAPVPVNVCNAGILCSKPLGVAVNGDTGIAAVANFQGSIPANSPTGTQPVYYFSFLTMTLSSPSSTTPTGAAAQLDQGPTAVATDPNLNYAAFTTAVSTISTPQGAVNVMNLAGAPTRVGQIIGLSVPTGIVFDPLNLVFLVSDEGANNVWIVNPNNNAFTALPIKVGVAPAALDYNYQTSTLVMSNYASNTLSLLDYLCPPNGVQQSCSAPEVRREIALPSSQQFSVAIDLKLNLAVVADQQDNRVLLVPLP
jgi:YVTN family beta-propeller protein